MRKMIESIKERLLTSWKRIRKYVRVIWKRIAYRLNTDRTARSKAAYVALSAGTVIVAFLLVLLNVGIFAIAENRLFGKEAYENITIATAGGITDPLSRPVRVDLYRSCTVEGPERATLPEERSRSDATAQVETLWKQTLENLADEKGTLKTGEKIDRILRDSKYTARLRDFYNEDSGTKIAVWGAQAYYNAAGGRVYCLSAELDTRTQDVYSLTVALFDNIDGSDAVSDFLPMLSALGEATSVAETAIVNPTEYGSQTTLTLSDGIRLYRHTYIGSQIYLTLG